jgi:hypothetical protein
MIREDKGTKKNNSARMKMLDRIIQSYKAQKLRLKADEIQQQQESSDLSKRMRTGYNKNKHKIKNAEPDKKDNTRQRKINDLQNRPNSWKGLRERQSNAIKRQEEYKQEQKPNPFGKLSYEEVWDIADKMTEDEIIELGFAGEEDFYDYINQAFTLDEA